MNKEFEYSLSELETELPKIAQKGVTELFLHDKTLSNDKKKLLHFLKLVEKYYPSLFVKTSVDLSVLDMEVCRAASILYCAFDVVLAGSVKTIENKAVYLFDKKKYAVKSAILNDFGIVFGFLMDFAVLPGDSFKLFRERFDFALAQYPNHIDFPFFEIADIENNAELKTSDKSVENRKVAKREVLREECTFAESATPKPSATFSSQDIRAAKNIAFACKTFYSCGRAVPWFLSVLAPLKIQPSKFFADFAEWQRCNNCNLASGFNPDVLSHKEIEKMQLVFLSLKYEEKHKETLFPIVKDIVTLNGAFSRLTGDGQISQINLLYNPDDLFSPEAMDISSFAENVLLEPCTVKIFAGEDGPEYKIL